jgi:hypothetical protein
MPSVPSAIGVITSTGPLASERPNRAGLGNTRNARGSPGGQDVQRYFSSSAGADPFGFSASSTERLPALRSLLQAPTSSLGRAPEGSRAAVTMLPAVQYVLSGVPVFGSSRWMDDGKSAESMITAQMARPAPPSGSAVTNARSTIHDGPNVSAPKRTLRVG